MPEAENGHLVRLFGKVYADTAMKSQAALHLPKSVERNLEKRCDQVEKMFHKEFLPGLHKEITHWQAVDFSKHNLENQLALVDRLTCYFVDEVYVVPEQINILASFLNLKAEAACARQGLDVLQALHCDMPHAPSHMIAKAADMPDAQRKPYLLQTMGHRALFDYELSMPRYAEAPEMLWKLAKTSVLPSHPANDTGADTRVDDLPDVVALALQFQDLKEYAKHESLRIFAVLRRALLAVDHHFGDKGLVFYLTHAELSECCESNLAELRARAQGRVDVEEATK